MSENNIRDTIMKQEYDFSTGVRGKFYRKDASLNLPVYLEPSNLLFVEKTAKEKYMCTEANKDVCTTAKTISTETSSVKHVCTDDCHKLGCDAVKANEAKLSAEKHVCTVECKENGCTAANVTTTGVKSAQHVCTDACKDGCNFAESSSSKHICTDDCKDGCTAKT